MPRRSPLSSSLSPAARELVGRFETFYARMEQARAALRAGEVPDLAPVQELLDEILARFRELPPGEGPVFEPHMLALVVEVRELGRALAEALDETGRELARTARHGHAARAYAQARSHGEEGP